MKPTNDNGAHSFTEGATFDTAENINEFLKEEKNMEVIYLKSMTDFVLEQRMTTEEVRSSNFYDIQTHIYKYYDKVFNYANFLKQPLKLEMFVPCDENGNVLDPSDAFRSCEKGFVYSKAKERVLFKGLVFEESQKEALKNNTQLSVSIYTENSFYITHRLNGKLHTWFDLKTVEELIKCKIELSKTAIKQIGL